MDLIVCFVRLLAACSLALGVSGLALAHGPWRDVPQDERRVIREEMREHWRQDREQQAYREYQERHQYRWRDVPLEDRRRIREEIREQREWAPSPPPPPAWRGR